jgi:hypothetical protein
MKECYDYATLLENTEGKEAGDTYRGKCLD